MMTKRRRIKVEVHHEDDRRDEKSTSNTILGF